MDTTLITTTNDAATLSEKELWSRFISSMVLTTYSMGLTVDAYRPAELMVGGGNYRYIGDFSAKLASAIGDAEDPGESLRCAIEEVKVYLADLEVVSDAFSTIKQSFAIKPDYEAVGNGEVRFREPVTARKEAA